MKGHPYVHMKPIYGGPWELLKKSIDKYDDEMCKGWKDDLDTMLVFVCSNLFSPLIILTRNRLASSQLQ